MLNRALKSGGLEWLYYSLTVQCQVNRLGFSELHAQILPYLSEGTWWSSDSVMFFWDPLVLRINCLVIRD